MSDLANRLADERAYLASLAAACRPQGFLVPLEKGTMEAAQMSARFAAIERQQRIVADLEAKLPRGESAPAIKSPKRQKRGNAKRSVDPQVASILEDESLDCEATLVKLSLVDSRFIGWSQEALAELTGYSARWIRKTNWWQRREEARKKPD